MNIQESFFNRVSEESFELSDFLIESQKELQSKKTPAQPVYTVETTSKAARIAINIILGILSALFFPYGLWRLMHVFAGKLIVPAQNDTSHKTFRRDFVHILCGNGLKIKREGRKADKTIYRGIAESQKGGAKLTQTEEGLRVEPPLPEDKTSNYFVAKRISVMVDGKNIDAMILGRKKNLMNKKWTLYSNPNGMTYEGLLRYGAKDVVEKIDTYDTNILLYNYQGVGASEGRSTCKGIVNAHRAMLKFLEDKENGIGAEEIVQTSWSLGGGVQGEAMRKHEIQGGIRYLLAKELSFSRLSKVPGSFLGGLMKFFGWELNSQASAKVMEEKNIAEIVVQRGRRKKDGEIEYLDDGVIPAEAAYGASVEGSPYRKIIPVSCNHSKRFKAQGVVKAVKVQQKEEIREAFRQALAPGFTGFQPAN